MAEVAGYDNVLCRECRRVCCEGEVDSFPRTVDVTLIYAAADSDRLQRPIKMWL